MNSVDWENLKSELRLRDAAYTYKGKGATLSKVDILNMTTREIEKRVEYFEHKIEQRTREDNIDELQLIVNKCFDECGDNTCNLIVFDTAWRPQDDVEKCDDDYTFDMIWGEDECKDLNPVGTQWLNLSEEEQKAMWQEWLKLYNYHQRIRMYVEHLTGLSAEKYFENYLETTWWNGCLAITKDLKIYSIIRKVEPKLLNTNQPLLLCDLLKNKTK